MYSECAPLKPDPSDDSSEEDTDDDESDNDIKADFDDLEIRIISLEGQDGGNMTAVVEALNLEIG